MKKNNKQHYLKIIFGLWILQGFFSFVWLFLIPTDAENGYLFGFTTSRLILLGISLLLILISTTLFFYKRLPFQIFFDIDIHRPLWDIIYLIFLLIFFIAPAVLIILYSLQGNNQYLAYAQRLTPLVVWFWLAAIEIILFIVYFRYQNAKDTVKPFKLVWKKIIITLLILFGITLTVAITKIGVTPDNNIGAPGIPLLEWQIILTFLVLVIFSFLSQKKRISLDKWLIPFIYFFTLTLWLSQPVNPAYTATPPRAPNFEIYPFSDPQIYIQYAQSALVGNGFLYPEVPSRPLYVALLTWFHLLGAQDYNNVVVIQSLLLAFFPVTLYLIGKELGSRSLGFALAILIAFRDVNANIAVPFASNVTYSKLFLSEMPLALSISLVTLITIRWLKHNHPPTWMSLIIGSILGAATLIRTQSVGLILIIMFLAFLTISKWRWCINRKVSAIRLLECKVKALCNFEAYRDASFY